MALDYVELHDNLKHYGTILLKLGEHPLTEAELDRLDQLSEPSNVPYEHVDIGDAGESNYVDVARFMTDVEKPQRVNDEAADEVLAILGSPKMMEFYDQVVRTNLVIRRCQVNVLHKGGFVGFHLDTDSNPDYISPIVIQFSSDYGGGNYVVHHPIHSAQEFKMPRYSMIISTCNLPHEVSEVTSGRRKSLVYFLSNHAGNNRRWENCEVEVVDAMANTSVAAVSST
jgi:Uncharacterized iron-regulated protein